MGSKGRKTSLMKNDLFCEFSDTPLSNQVPEWLNSVGELCDRPAKTFETPESAQWISSVWNKVEFGRCDQCQTNGRMSWSEEQQFKRKQEWDGDGFVVVVVVVTAMTVWGATMWRNTGTVQSSWRMRRKATYFVNGWGDGILDGTPPDLVVSFNCDVCVRQQIVEMK